MKRQTFEQQTPILNQLLIDEGWLWCYRCDMAHSLSDWLRETRPVVVDEVRISGLDEFVAYNAADRASILRQWTVRDDSLLTKDPG